MIKSYVESSALSEETRSKLLSYLTLVSKRASGALLTNAAWIRQFVAQHPDYRHDSIVGESVAYDLCARIDAVGRGGAPEPALLG